MFLTAADLRSACNADQYFSVDNRPVSADKGLMKELSKTYKQYLRSSLESGIGASTLTKPFLVLRISCPPDSYDVNVEPAKDELMFYNSTDLRDLFIKLVRDVYGDLKEKTEAIPLPKRPVGFKGTTANSFNLLLAIKPSKAVSLTSRRPILASKHSSQKIGESSTAVTLQENREAIDPSAEARCGSESPQGPEKLRELGKGANHTENQRAHVNMFTAEDDNIIEDEDITPPEEGVTHNDENDDAAVRNPWSLAKLNIRIPPKRMGAPDQSASSVCNSEPNEGTKPSSYSHRIRLGGRSTSTSPTRDSRVPLQNPGPPMRPWARRLTESDDDSLTSSASDSGEPRPHKTRLDTWVQGDFQAGNNESLRRIQNPSQIEHQAFFHTPQSMSHRQQGSASNTERPLRRKMAQNSSQQQRLSLPFKTPFKQNSPRQYPSPVASSEPHSNTRIPMATVDDHQAGFHRPSLALGTPLTSSGGELDDILEFERRKRLVTAQYRKQQAMKGNWNTPSSLPSPSSHPSASGIDGAAMYAAAFPRATSRPGSADPSTKRQPDFESRFGTNGPAEQEQLQQPTPPRSNPHHNRYLAATRNLSRPQSPPNPDVMSHAHPEPRTAPEHDGTALEDDEYVTELPKIPDSDPRAYFMRFRQQQHQQAHADTNGLTRTGLKIRRAKTVRLPLEATPVGAGVHDLAVEVRTLTEGGEDEVTGFKGGEGVRKKYAILEKVDEYIKTGHIETLSWSPFSKDVEEWEMTIKALVETKYRPRALDGVSDGDTGATDGDDARGPFEFELNLSRALKAFIDGDLA
jgi:DNA mismatch repair protein, C-terminal domain